MAGKGKDFSCKGNQPHVQMLRSTKYPAPGSAKPSGWLEHRVDALDGGGRGGGIEGKQAGKVLIWFLNPTWPDLLADLSSSVFWDRLIGITDGPAGWWALYLMTMCRVLMPCSLV